MKTLWQEISLLKKELTRLEKSLSLSVINKASHPIVRLGEILEINDISGNKVYGIRERNVNSNKDNIFRDVRCISEDIELEVGSFVMFYLDSVGERYIFPSSNEVLKVDHITEANHSTKIYDIKADGTVDPANIGTTKNILRVENNETHIRNVSKFHDDTTKKGPLDFSTNTYPSITIPGTPANYEVKLVWHSATSKWKWIAIGEASSVSLTYARVRWNYDGIYDRSEAELMTYDSGTGLFAATGVVIWIDTELSKQVQFWTGGDDTIFMVRKIKDNENRDGTIRDLYYVFHCFSDHGSAITHLSTITTSPPTMLHGILLSTDLDATPWDNVAAATINTTIVAASAANQMLVNISKEWTTAGAKNWNFVEASDFSRGQRLGFRPIRPIMDDVLNNFYRSGQELLAGGTIAEYVRL